MLLPDEEPSNSREIKALRGVWDYYVAATKRNPNVLSFTELRKRKGLQRLRECLRKTGGDLARAEALMELAIDRLAASDWHMGRDPKTCGKSYCEWEMHLFSSAERLERWLADGEPSQQGARQ